MTPEPDRSTDARILDSVHDVVGTTSFDAAAGAVLDHLSSACGLPLWMVTRTAGDDWIVLRATDSPYGLRTGDVLRWSDSLCARMVRGQGPRIAPRVADVPAYRSAPIARSRPIGSYVGIPLTGPDGELFGTLCGIGAAPSGADLTDAQPALDLQAALLSTLLAAELLATRSDRAAEAARLRVADRVVDRSCWSALLQAEQHRCSPHATPVSIITLQVDPDSGSRAVDGLVQRLLLDRRRPADTVACTGPGSYAVLCPETSEAVAQPIATDLVLRLQHAGVVASCGVAVTDPHDRDLVAAWERAELLLRADQAAVSPAAARALACA